MSSPNPYAPPGNDAAVPAVPPNHLRNVQRVYWWVGFVGTTACGLSVGLGVFAALADIVDVRRDDIATLVPVAVAICFHAFFFNYCRITANRLSAESARFRRRSRLVGFVMATLYFPILTVPGLYCVWKIDKHFKESSGDGTELPLHGLPT